MHPVEEFLSKLYYDPAKQIFFISCFEAAQIPRMKEFLRDTRIRGTQEFHKAFESYINDKKYTVAGESGPIELTEFQMQLLKAYEK